MISSLHMLACPDCGTEHRLDDVFEHCASSWPEHYLLYFKCPGCKATRHLQVHDDQVAVGYLDVTPGPRFVSQKQVTQPGLTVQAEEDGLALALAGNSWFISARE